MPLWQPQCHDYWALPAINLTYYGETRDWIEEESVGFQSLLPLALSVVDLGDDAKAAPPTTTPKALLPPRSQHQ